MAKKPTIEHVEASLKKWRTRMKRAMTVIQKLERQYARLVIAKPTHDRTAKLKAAFTGRPEIVCAKPTPQSIAKRIHRPDTDASPQRVSHDTHPANIESEMLHGKTQTMGIVHDAPKPAPLVVTVSVPAKPDDGIPDFLKRGIAAQKAANEVIEQIKAEQADTKKRKAQGRIAKMKAKQRGDLKRMPLSGKAALAAIDSD